MDRLDKGEEQSENSKNSLTPEEKIKRREVIKRSAEKITETKRRERYFKQKYCLKNDKDYRVIQELIDLGISPSSALRLATRTYARGTFHELEDFWLLSR